MARYDNPVVRGHAPDPSAVRVGDDFFLASSSFEMLPGIPIRHSTDLVTWRIIGHAVTRPDQYRRDGRPGPLSLFAPTLRYDDGVFRLVCTNPKDRQGNFMVTANDPAGPWSSATWIDEDWFDPSLFRDEDGTWYYTRRDLRFGAAGGLGPVVQAEIEIDTGALGGFRELTPGDRGFASNDIEGPHLYRVGDWYYLSAAEGSSWVNHMQTIGRSRSPWGPFEPAPHNPILTHRHRTGHPVQTLGHAELLDDASGNWWALSLGTRHARFAQHHNFGRETFLTPVTWRDGWPYVGVDGTSELSFEDVALPEGEGTVSAPVDTVWTRGWTTWGLPAVGFDPLISPTGSIAVPFGADPVGTVDRTDGFGALFLPQSEHAQLFSATVTAVGPTGRAGVAVWSDATHCYSALLVGAGEGRRIEFRRVVDDLVLESAVPLSGDGPVDLTIESSVGSYLFRADADGQSVEIGAGSARLLSAEGTEWFTAVNFALLSIGPESDGESVFDDVTVDILSEQEPPIQLPI
jgi:xylan 1,4-beta-xylosidase